MLLIAHTISGGVVGELVNNWPAAFLLGIILHFILDAIPHYDRLAGEFRWSFAQIALTAGDFVITIWLLLFIIKIPLNISLFTSPFAWGALGSFIPDAFDNVPLWSKQFRASKYGSKFHKFHEALHWSRPGVLVGMSTQILLVAAFLYLHFHR